MIDHQGLGVVGYAVMGKRKPRSAEAATAGDRLSIRLDLASGARIGPGKVAVLEEIGAVRLDLRRRTGVAHVLSAHLGIGRGTESQPGHPGGRNRGGRQWWRRGRADPAGKAVIERYRAIEMDTALAARKHLLALNRACASK